MYDWTQTKSSPLYFLTYKGKKIAIVGSAISCIREPQEIETHNAEIIINGNTDSPIKVDQIYQDIIDVVSKKEEQ